ncbi:MAG: heavy metal-associated domain-containing protein [Acidobacteriota bacterium]
MKHLNFSWIASALVAIALMLHAPSMYGTESKLEHTTLTIKGMTCGGCVAAVKHRLSKVEGVTDYAVSLEKGEAEVSYEPDLTTPVKIAAAVSKTGFKASVKDSGDPNKDDSSEDDAKKKS